MRQSYKNAIVLTGMMLLGISPLSRTAFTDTPTIAPAPFYQDLNNLGSADPEIVWHSHEKEWWIFYNARRVMEADVNAGTPIGVIASRDWKSWKFIGYCSLDGVGPSRSPGGRSMKAPYTCWAPAIIRDNDTYHLFVTFSQDNTGFWGGPKSIRHYIAPASNLLHGWKAAPDPEPITLDGAIDAGLFKNGDTWQLYFRAMETQDTSGKKKIARTFIAESNDLNHWNIRGPLKGDINNRRKVHYIDPNTYLPVDDNTPGAATLRMGYMEAQYPFYWKDKYWLSTDPYLWVSDDGKDWRYAGSFLHDLGSERNMDNTRGRHASFAVLGERCFAFYHVEPLRDYRQKYQDNPPEHRINYLQMIELFYRNGKLSYDRSAAVKLPPHPRPEGEYWGQAAPE